MKTCSTCNAQGNFDRCQCGAPSCGGYSCDADRGSHRFIADCVRILLKTERCERSNSARWKLFGVFHEAIATNKTLFGESRVREYRRALDELRETSPWDGDERNSLKAYRDRSSGVVFFQRCFPSAAPCFCLAELFSSAILGFLNSYHTALSGGRGVESKLYDS
jgi:hypothetical protein